MRNILITGITGQDGLFLISHLQKKYEKINIYGVSRTANLSNFFKNLKYLNIDNYDNISIDNIDLLNNNSVENYLNDIKPDMVFNLSGPSSVYESLKEPNLIKNNIETIFNNLTGSLLKQKNMCNFFQASSSELFAKNLSDNIDETSLIKPNSPYGDAKLFCHQKVIELNKKYGWKIVSGLMFNHESEFRKDNFLIMKIINAAINISKNRQKNIEVGSLNYIRDWMHASDTTRAILEITEDPKFASYVIGSGKGNSIETLLKTIFLYFELNYLDHVQLNTDLLRNGDSPKIISNPKRLKNNHNWEQLISFNEMILRIIKFKARF